MVTERDPRWSQFEGRSKVVHLIHEEATAWAQAELHGALITRCGRVGNEALLIDPPNTEVHCKVCARRLEKSGMQ